jgi:hypothetical protein
MGFRARRAGRLRARDPRALTQVDLSDTYLNLQQFQIARAAVPHSWVGRRRVLMFDAQAIAMAQHETAVLAAAIAARNEELRGLTDKPCWPRASGLHGRMP